MPTGLSIGHVYINMSVPYYGGFLTSSVSDYADIAEYSHPKYAPLNIE